MLKDCIEIFKNVRENYIEEDETHSKLTFITDSYPLGIGTYILIGRDGNIIKRLNIDKNNEDESIQDENYQYFATLDYLSVLIDTNKAVDPKKLIHSNNYYSFFIKKEALNTKLTQSHIDEYYKILRDPKFKYKEEKLEIYNDLENELGKPNSEEIDIIQNWIETNLIKQDFFKKLPDMKQDKGYLKIFFDYPFSSYERENKRYILPNIYNQNKFNIELNGVIYGMPNDNINLNDKKIYLRLKSRKNEIPYIIDSDEVLEQKYFFDYLKRFLGKKENNIYVGFDNTIKGYKDFPTDKITGYFLRVNKGKEPEIKDVTSIIEKEIQINIKNEDIFNLSYQEVPDYYKIIKEIKILSTLINDIFYSKCLKSNYFKTLKEITLPKQVSITPKLIADSKKIWEELFFKQNDRLLKTSFIKMGMDIIKNTILFGNDFKACEQLNLYIAISNYILNQEDKTMSNVKNIYNSLNKKINSETTEMIESENEYFFAVGQLVKYYVSLNKSAEKTHSLINPILNCKDITKLESELEKMFKKYNYNIGHNSKRFNNLYAMVLSYENSTKINIKYLIIGYLFNSLIYFKEEK